MSKISLETVAEILNEEGVDKNKQAKIIEHLQEILKAEKEEKDSEKLPRQKNELGVILLNDNDEIKTDNISALVYEIPSSENHDSVLDKIKKATAEFNNTKKGQKHPVKSFSEAFQVVKPKQFKAQNMKKRTKSIVRCLITADKI